LKAEIREPCTFHLDLGQVHVWMRPEVQSGSNIVYSVNITWWQKEPGSEGIGRWQRLPTCWLTQAQLVQLVQKLSEFSAKGAATGVPKR